MAALAEEEEVLPATNRPEEGKFLGEVPPAELGTQGQSCLQGGPGMARVGKKNKVYKQRGVFPPPPLPQGFLSCYDMHYRLQP